MHTDTYSSLMSAQQRSVSGNESCELASHGSVMQRVARHAQHCWASTRPTHHALPFAVLTLADGDIVSTAVDGHGACMQHAAHSGVK